MTVGELLARCSAAELAEWEAYFRLEAEDAKAPTIAGHVTDPEAMLGVFRAMGERQ